MSPIDPAFVAILVCPKCKQAMIDTSDSLACIACRLGFPIIEGVPVLLVEEARTLSPDEADRLRSAVKSRP